MKRRVKAFTIIELIMSLIISSILVGIIYSIYLIVSSQVGNYQQRAAVISEFLTLRNVMEQDFEKAETIKDSVNFLSLNSPFGNIRYEFSEEGIRRYANGVIDSFKLKNSERQNIYVSETMPLVVRFQMDVIVGKEKSLLVCKKKYSAADLIRAEENTYEW